MKGGKNFILEVLAYAFRRQRQSNHKDLSAPQLGGIEFKI